jgi:hypothetical protein
MQHNRPQIFKERYASISHIWQCLVRLGKVNAEFFTLNRAIMERSVRHYIDELGIIKIKYGIEKLAQSQKMAGAAAVSIMKFRPVVPLDGGYYGSHIEGETVNERLAIFHGIIVCADHYIRNYGGSKETVSAFLKTDRFEDWLNKFVYLLKERTYTSESIIMIFDGFCLANFPEAVEKELKAMRDKESFT